MFSSACMIKDMIVSSEMQHWIYYNQFDYFLKTNNADIQQGLQATKHFRQLHHHKSLKEYLFTFIQLSTVFLIMLITFDMWTQKSFEHALYQVHYGSESVLISTVASKVFTFFPPEWPAQWRNKEKRKMCAITLYKKSKSSA